MWKTRMILKTILGNTLVVIFFSKVQANKKLYLLVWKRAISGTLELDRRSQKD